MSEERSDIPDVEEVTDRVFTTLILSNREKGKKFKERQLETERRGLD